MSGKPSTASAPPAPGCGVPSPNGARPALLDNLRRRPVAASQPYLSPRLEQRDQRDAAGGALGVTVWSTPWSPPREWKTNNDNDRGGYLDPSHYQDYATQLATYALNMKALGVPLYAIYLQNEPDMDVSYESCLSTEDQFAAFLPYVGETFAARVVTTKIMLPENSNWSFDKANSIMANPNLSKYVGILAA